MVRTMEVMGPRMEGDRRVWGILPDRRGLVVSVVVMVVVVSGGESSAQARSASARDDVDTVESVSLL